MSSLLPLIKYFKLSFCSYLFIAPVFPPSFAHMRSLLSLALSFKALLSFCFMSVPSLLFLPLFFFSTVSPLPFLYYIRFHFPSPFPVFCPLPVASCLHVRANTPRHHRPIKLLLHVLLAFFIAPSFPTLHLRTCSGWVCELMHNLFVKFCFGPSFPKGSCVWICRGQRPYVTPSTASVVSPVFLYVSSDVSKEGWWKQYCSRDRVCVGLGYSVG
jgi:hypothetical protein